MATINIANLTFTHKGDYDGSTAYVKNDVVYYATNGNAYIAKQATTGNAPTNGTYWSQFAAGSGGIWNAGLSLGSAGQSVKVNAAGNALEFGTISSDFVKLATQELDSTGVSSFEFQNVFSSANDALYGGYYLQMYHQGTANTGIDVRFLSGTNTEENGSTDYRYAGNEGYGQTNNANRNTGYNMDVDGRDRMPWDGWGLNGANDRTEGQFYSVNIQGRMYDNSRNRSLIVHTSARDPSSPNYIVGVFRAFRFEGSANLTGMKFYFSSGNMTNGTCTLWGLKK